MANPYDKAFENMLGTVDGLVRDMGPPRRIAKPLERFRNQIGNVPSHQHQLRAILRLYGQDGFKNYVDTMTSVDKLWRKPDGGSRSL